MDTGELLEPVEDDDDEAVVDLRIGRLADVELVQEETVKRERLFVDDVAPRVRIQVQTRHAAGRRPVLGQRRLLKKKKKGKNGDRGTNNRQQLEIY